MTGARELPPPLPPETRTIGQVVAKSVRLYQRRFWPSLSLGLPVAAVDGIALALPDRWPIVFVPVAGAVLLSAWFIGASALAAEVRPDRRSILVALAAGALVFLPFPFLVLGFVLPGLAWLAFLGLSVPAAVIERLGVRASLRRAVQLARADYIHVLGGLATLAIVVFLTRSGSSSCCATPGTTLAHCVPARGYRDLAIALPRRRAPLFRSSGTGLAG